MLANKHDSSSDSEDGNDEQMRKFKEAADTTLLTNAMYQEPPQKDSSMNENTNEYVLNTACEQKVPQSNRYLLEDDAKADADFITTDMVREHIAKKLTQIIEKNIEFCDFENPTVKQKMSRDRVKLLADACCYVKPYEEFEFETKGPTKKPTIKRRTIEEHDEKIEHEDRCRLVSVTSDDIVAGKLTAGWMPKAERKHKMSYYKCDAAGKLHLKPIENEFTKLRNKNQWNESKIKLKMRISSKGCPV